MFRQYLNTFISDLWENGVLGRGIARVHVIEFEKRGYPHVHILLTVRQEDKPRDVRWIFDSVIIDSVISAKIPNREELPLLWDSVLIYDARFMWGRQPRQCVHEKQQVFQRLP